MDFPTPEPGLVIRYAYLWHDDFVKGAEEGTKDRPCVVIVAVNKTEDDKLSVIVAPVTHSPQASETSFQLSPETKKRLQLDEQQSWVVLTDLNKFIWPGPDLRPIQTGNSRRYTYGILPAAVFVKIREDIVRLASNGKAKVVKRTE